MTIWSILWPLEILNGHLVYFVVIWYISPRFGILYQEKSGNPVSRVFLLQIPTVAFVHTRDLGFFTAYVGG
jgi:hypothetical protein